MGVTSSRSARKGTSTLFAWLFGLGLVISLIIHLGLYVRAKGIRMPGFSAESYDTIVPRTFRMKRVEIDSRTLENPTPTPTPRPVEKPPTLPEERPLDQAGKPQSGEGSSGNNGKPPLRDLLGETVPREIPTEQGRPGTGVELLPDPSSAARQTSGGTDDPATTRPPVLPEPLESVGGTTPKVSTNGAAAPGFSSLDDLLAGTRTITPETPPILMPTDLLFGYDSDVLRPEAADSLAKLGTIIRNARNSKFRIEGHTDSFGTDAYNDALSLRRAEAVKAWLVTTMGIPADRISTAGLGKSHPLVSVTGSIPEQQLNRRVEIVITKD